MRMFSHIEDWACNSMIQDKESVHNANQHIMSVEKIMYKSLYKKE